MKKVLAFLSLLFLFSTITAQQINDTSTLRSVINSQIVPNSNRAITALTLNRILNGYLNTRVIPYSWALQPSKPVYSWSELTGKPILFDGDYNSLINKPFINYDSITSVPTNWLDIIDKPIFNIDNWNTAYSWGNHSGLYRPIGYVPSWSEITSKPTFFSGNYSDLIGSPTLNITNWNTAYSWGNHAGLYRPLSYVPAWSEITGKPTLDITNWNTAYSWGNHAGLYRPLSYVPAWSEITGKPTLDITNWNTAYSWGNHAGLYRPITYNPDWTEITGKPILDFANWNTAYSWGNHAGQYKPISYVPAWSEITGKPTINTTDWNTAYSWGNHAGLYRPITYVPAWSEITGKPTLDIANWNTAYSWGNHAGLYKSTSYTPAWSEITGKPTLDIVNWNTAYSWGNHTGLYRAISYVPSWSEITSKPSFDYLPLSGGTLTGTLNGTILSMSGSGSFGGLLKATVTSTTNPSLQLDYNGSSNYAKHLMNNNGDYVISAPTANGLTSGNLILQAGGSNALVANGSTQNILIKTTTDNGTDAMQVAGSVRATEKYITTSGSGYTLVSGASELFSLGYSGGTLLNRLTGTSFFIAENGTPQLSIAPTGAATFSSSVAAQSGSFLSSGYTLEAGSTGATQKVRIGVNSTGYSSIQGTNLSNTATNLTLNPDGGNVGIGNITPSYKLDVTGTINSSSIITSNSLQLNSIVTDGSSKLETSGNVRNVGNNTASQMVHGSWYPNMSTHSGSITLPATSTTYLYKETSNVTWTLETAYGHNRYYIIRAADIGNVTIALQSGQYIMKKDGSNVTTLTATLSGGAIHLQSDGVSKWYEL